MVIVVSFVLFGGAGEARAASRVNHLGVSGKTFFSTRIPISGLVGHWTFDPDDMTLNVRDISGNSLNGHLSGYVSTTTTAGRYNRALTFDGSNDYVDFDAAPSIQALDTISVAAMVRIANYPGADSAYQHYIASTQTDQVYYCGWWFYLGDWEVPASIKKVGFSFRNSADNAFRGSGMSTTELQLNRWYHVVMTYDQVNARIYVNGKLEASSATTDGIKNCDQFYIGAEVNAFGRLWDGDIDYVQIYNRGLTAEEVKKLYVAGTIGSGYANVTFTPPNLAQGLVGHWTFDGPDIIQNVKDASGSGNTGRLVSFTSTTTVAGKTGQGLRFDGVNDYVNIDAVANDVTGNMSMGAWINAQSGVPHGGIITRNDSGAGNVVLMMITSDVIRIWDAGSGAYEATSTIDVADGSWHHVFYTKNGTLGTVYIDGVSNATHTTNYTQSTSDRVSMGQEYDGGTPTDFFIGSIDDARIYSRALSASEVMQLYKIGI